MTGPSIGPARVSALLAVERARVAASRARRERVARTRFLTPRDGVHRPGRAASALALHHALLHAATGAPVAEIAAVMSRYLPIDSRAAAHRHALLAGLAAEGAPVDLSAWRTPAEARWSDEDLYAARNRRAGGARDEATLAAARAADRVLRRRHRAARKEAS